MDRGKILPWIAQYSPHAWVSKTIRRYCIQYVKPPDMGNDQKDPTHTANFGIGLKKRCDEMGIECHVLYPNARTWNT